MIRKKTLSTSEVADLLDVCLTTVQRWCRDGKVPATRVGGGNWRISTVGLRQALGINEEEHDGDVSEASG